MSGRRAIFFQGKETAKTRRRAGERLIQGLENCFVGLQGVRFADEGGRPSAVAFFYGLGIILPTKNDYRQFFQERGSSHPTEQLKASSLPEPIIQQDETGNRVQ